MKTAVSPITRGFSLVEVLVIIAGIAVVSSGGYMAVTGVQETASANKLQSDVASINRSIDIYIANGGNLDGVSGSADTDHGIDVLKRLKQKGASSVGTVLESQSSVLDPRVKAEWMSSNESASTKVRAVWDASSGSFALKTSGTGIKRFVMDDSAATAAASLEALNRSTTKQIAASGWHWGYTTATPTERYSGYNPTATLTDALTQNYGNPPFVVGPDGIVEVSYVYRGAGYAGSLAIVSLEGMGAENYDLDTAEGQRQFLMELMRRVVDQDRGEVIIDVSKDKATANTSANQTLVVEDKKFQFRPGDTVAAILIPNGTFEQALAMLQGIGDISDNPDALYQLANNTYKGDQSSNSAWVQSVTGTSKNSSQLFGITSLSRETESGSNFPFYEEKFAAIGTNTNTYTLEDLIVNSDQDYEDIVFKAVGLEATGAFANVIEDPYAYYTANGRWNQTTQGGGGQTLGEALIEVGVVDASTVP